MIESPPARSVFGLMQEDLWPNEWLILVVCMFLNQTSRKQVEKVLPTFVKRWPRPKDLLEADPEEIRNLVRSLGFVNRRTDNLLRMTEAYLSNGWKHAKELPGIGAYAARAWEIFCEGNIGTEPPRDHALLKYWCWITKNEFIDPFKNASKWPRQK